MKTQKLMTLIVSVALLPTLGFAGESEKAADQLQGMLGISRDAKDAFAGIESCPAPDSGKPNPALTPVTLDQALKNLEPCLKAVSAHYAVTVVAGQGDGMIMLSIKGIPFIGNNVLQDLRYALTIRGNRLYGYNAGIAPASQNLGIPRDAKDAFAGISSCPDTNMRMIRGMGPQEAINALQPCLAAVGQRYDVTITANILALKGWGLEKIDTTGIGLAILGQVMIGNSVNMDVKHALDLRADYLYGVPAQVVTYATLKP